MLSFFGWIGLNGQNIYSIYSQEGINLSAVIPGRRIPVPAGICPGDLELPATAFIVDLFSHSGSVKIALM